MFSGNERKRDNVEGEKSYMQIGSNSVNEISNVKKKSLKKIKYWQRNGGFKAGVHIKAVFWLGIMFLMQISSKLTSVSIILGRPQT